MGGGILFRKAGDDHDKEPPRQRVRLWGRGKDSGKTGEGRNRTMKERYITPEMDVERLEQTEDILTASTQAVGLFGDDTWVWTFDSQ